jgi:hypothetical protein
MNVKIKAQIVATFVEHMVGIGKESKKPYNFINLSNGIEKLGFETTLTKEDTNSLTQGDEVTCDVVADLWNPRKNAIINII